MPKSREYFHLTGKFYICSAPRQVTRFSPPVLPHVSSQTEDLAAQRQISNHFWEGKRVEQWRTLPPKVRASYTWPMAGSVPKGPATSFQCLAMEDMAPAELPPMSPIGRSNNRDSVTSQDGAFSFSSPSSPSSVTSFQPLSPISASQNRLRNDNPAKILHDIALDNFCLLVFRPLEIVHFESSPLPPKRTVSASKKEKEETEPLSLSLLIC